MKSSEFTYGGSVNINGILVPKMRGRKPCQVMKDKSKYCRKAKHLGRKEW